MQAIEFAHRLDAKIAAERVNLQNSLLISLLAGNLTVETGLTATASATNFVHFCAVRPRMFAFDSCHSLANRWPRWWRCSLGVPCEDPAMLTLKSASKSRRSGSWDKDNSTFRHAKRSLVDYTQYCSSPEPLSDSVDLTGSFSRSRHLVISTSSDENCGDNPSS
jgi:hypothetical protein